MTTTQVHGTCRWCNVNQGWSVVIAEGQRVIGMTNYYATKQTAWKAFKLKCIQNGWEWNTMLTIPRDR